MPKKFVVFVTYGVYVDAPDGLDWDSEEGYTYLRENAVNKLFEAGIHEVTSDSNIEAEDVTEEFEESN
jgi:hypothetical protein